MMQKSGKKATSSPSSYPPPPSQYKIWHRESNRITGVFDSLSPTTHSYDSAPHGSDGCGWRNKYNNVLHRRHIYYRTHAAFSLTRGTPIVIGKGFLKRMFQGIHQLFTLVTLHVMQHALYKAYSSTTASSTCRCHTHIGAGDTTFKTAWKESRKPTYSTHYSH